MKTSNSEGTLQGLPALRPGWTWALLSQLGELNRGKSKHRPRDDQRLYGGPYPFIQTGDVRQAHGGMIRSFNQTYSELGLQQSRLWPAGTLCITIAANIAETGILTFDACFPDSVVGFTATEGATLVRLVEYYIRTAKQELARYAPATAQKNINLETLFRLPVPVPPSRESASIVESLDSYLTRLDAAAEGLRRVEANLKRYRASVLKAAVEGRLVPTEAELAKREGRTYEPASDLLARILKERRRRWEQAELAKMKAKGESPKNDAWKSKYQEPTAPDPTNLPSLPEGWCWATAGFLCACIVPNRDKPKSFTGDIPWVTLPDLGGQIEVHSNHNGVGLTEAEVVDARAKVIPPGAVIMSCIGRFGLSAVVGRPVVVNQQLHAFLPATGLVPKYLAYALRTQIRFMEEKATSTTIAYLNQDNCNSVPVPLPPTAEQERIVAKVEALLSVEEQATMAAAKFCKRVSRLRQSILTWAFEGKLVDQDPNDEPASVLLDRIRAQREAGVSSGRAVRPPKKKAR